MSIEFLDPDVIGKIAAGEVVERPASAVKELVENALDAGSRSVHVEIAAGGSDLILVADDGVGIPGDQLEIAVQRHATSKIKTAADLERIATLGFRGEALASIAAVSEMRISSHESGASNAWELEVNCGVVNGKSVVPRAVGTTVTVERLFFNVPARRKFLRSAASEAGQIAQLLSQLALAYPEVAFTLEVDGRRTMATSGSGDLLDAASVVLGRDAASVLLPVEAVVEADRSVTSVAARISGYVADPVVSRATRSSTWLFVNRRPVKNRSLTYAIEDGYATLLQVGRHPVAVVNLEVPPAEVDVNVHPSKTEVRLLKERLIYAGLRDAVHSAVSAGEGWAKNVEVDRKDLAVEQSSWSSPRLIDAPVSAQATNEVVAGGRRLPILRVIGQIAQTYIIAEGEGGLYLIDQHAAHERVLLERITQSMGKEGNSQLSLEPLTLELTPAETQILGPSMQALESLGYRLEPFGSTSVLVRGVPVDIPERRGVDALKGTLADLADEKPGLDWREKLAISLSCRGAVKAGQTLSPEEMRALIIALEEMDITQHCSHGRPTAILLSRSQLEKEFGRR